ncbi:unnamed protein product [Symbiodinium natans]|uniref:Uncharacterized protein n=1 Tax=Symbiodinium natans TaxID=878477 RepID=A0A812KJC2_9DINO|nr:unnamed protein product [Symbiodinium natans]
MSSGNRRARSARSDSGDGGDEPTFKKLLDSKRAKRQGRDRRDEEKVEAPAWPPATCNETRVFNGFKSSGSSEYVTCPRRTQRSRPEASQGSRSPKKDRKSRRRRRDMAGSCQRSGQGQGRVTR